MNELKQIVLSPDPRLSEECAPVEKIDDEVRALAKRMLKIMYAADGCGLAGPQIGEMRQIVVIDVDYAGRGSKKNPYVLINPRVIAADGPEKRLAEGVASWLEGDTDAAKSIFESLASDPAVGEQAKANLEQVGE